MKIKIVLWMLLKSLDERHCVKAGCGLTKTQHETKPGKDGKASVRAARRFCFNNLVQIWPDLHYSCVNRILQGLKDTYMLLWGHVKWIMVWLVIYRPFYLENRRGSSLSKESLDCYPRPYRTLRLLAAIPCWTNALWSVTRGIGPQLPALAGAPHGSPILGLFSQGWGQGDHAQVPPWQYGHSCTTVYI